MTVKELIEKVQEFDEDLPVCINDYSDFAEAYENNIAAERKRYICFPFADTDSFDYVNLKVQEFDN